MKWEEWMGKRFATILLGSLVVIGCGGDPEKSRFSVGDKAIVVSHKDGDGEPSEYAFLDGCKDVPDLLPRLSLGTHIMVVDDTDMMDKGWSTRKVKVRVEDGPYRGHSGIVTRWDLAPHDW